MRRGLLIQNQRHCAAVNFLRRLHPVCINRQVVRRGFQFFRE